VKGNFFVDFVPLNYPDGVRASSTTVSEGEIEHQVEDDETFAEEPPSLSEGDTLKHPSCLQLRERFSHFEIFSNQLDDV